MMQLDAPITPFAQLLFGLFRIAGEFEGLLDEHVVKNANVGCVVVEAAAATAVLLATNADDCCEIGVLSVSLISRLKFVHKWSVLC
jgi:hypothetical protein